MVVDTGSINCLPFMVCNHAQWSFSLGTKKNRNENITHSNYCQEDSHHELLFSSKHIIARMTKWWNPPPPDALVLSIMLLMKRTIPTSDQHSSLNRRHEEESLYTFIFKIDWVSKLSWYLCEKPTKDATATQCGARNRKLLLKNQNKVVKKHDLHHWSIKRRHLFAISFFLRRWCGRTSIFFDARIFRNCIWNTKEGPER